MVYLLTTEIPEIELERVALFGFDYPLSDIDSFCRNGRFINFIVN